MQYSVRSLVHGLPARQSGLDHTAPTSQDAVLSTPGVFEIDALFEFPAKQQLALDEDAVVLDDQWLLCEHGRLHNLVQLTPGTRTDGLTVSKFAAQPWSGTISGKTPCWSEPVRLDQQAQR